MHKKKKHKKWGHPLNWLVIQDGSSKSVYNSFNTLLIPCSEIEPNTVMTTQQEEINKAFRERQHPSAPRSVNE